MQRYFIWLSYDGTAYHGWQVQPNGNSVQAEMQHALSVLLRSDIEIVGAGRTDAGVHARVMVAHFDFEGAVDCRQLAYKLNRLLPRDISVSRIRPVESHLHARFSAVRRTYHYYIHTRKDPFHRFYSCEIHYELDFTLMNQAAAHLLECSDFAAFCKVHTDVKTTICKVSRAEWIDEGDGCWHFVIAADRFLRNMVRSVVGTLIEVGRHRMTLDEFKRVVEGKNRSNAGESMPGNALFLENVEYAFDCGQS